MGKRVAIALQHVSPQSRSIRKRKRTSTSAANKSYWPEHENDDEDSSSNDTTQIRTLNQSSKHANNSSILLNVSFSSPNSSPKPVYTLRPSVVNGTILRDLLQKPWRLGTPIGKGNFGEIFLASNNTTTPATNANAKYVVKIEPHSNGPLFVEIHCLMNTARKTSNDDIPRNPPSGIPHYIASGSHYFGNARYRFLVLERFDRDLHSLIKNCRVHQKYVLTLAVHILNALESLHNKGYCHNDVKAQNLMVSKCKYYKRTEVKPKSKYYEQYDEKQQTTDSGNSSEQEANDEYEPFMVKRRLQHDDDDVDEDFDDGETTNSNNSNSMGHYQTPVNSRKRKARNAAVEYSGSNPVRSCRRQVNNSTYDDMIKSHYLRPTKRVSYSEFFNEDGMSVYGDGQDSRHHSTDEESEDFVPDRSRRSTASKKSARPTPVTTRNLRRQEKPVQEYVFTDNTELVEEEHIFLIDFGLASKFMERGAHRPFIMDQRRAHDGTLEYTSRDAHMGAHSRRSDLECLGYNLIFWSQGYLPWKECASQHQEEKVHQAKEYLMADVREMLKLIYGAQVPKYLGDFLHLINQLAYHEKPKYALYRQIFKREYQNLGYSLESMGLDSQDIARTCMRVKEETENKCDIFELKNKHIFSASSITKKGAAVTPFQERTLSNRVSPKNLRSKSDKKSTKKKKFCWAEILAQDPDQIARERAEQEFDRESAMSDVVERPPRKYEGKPTYAILERLARMQNTELLGCSGSDSEQEEDEDQEMAAEDDDDDEAESEQEVEDAGSEVEAEDEEEEDDNEHNCTDDDEDQDEDKSSGRQHNSDEDNDEDEATTEQADDDTASEASGSEDGSAVLQTRKRIPRERRPPARLLNSKYVAKPTTRVCGTRGKKRASAVTVEVSTTKPANIKRGSATRNKKSTRVCYHESPLASAASEDEQYHPANGYSNGLSGGKQGRGRSRRGYTYK